MSRGMQKRLSGTGIGKSREVSPIDLVPELTFANLDSSDGYVSFPDFERFHRSFDSMDAASDQALRQTAKT
jgi:hypothetical protein